MYGADLLDYRILPGVVSVNLENFGRNGEWDLLNNSQYISHYSATVGDRVFNLPVVGQGGRLKNYLKIYDLSARCNNSSQGNMH